MAWPESSLDVKIEFAFGADLDANAATWTWTDATSLGGDSDNTRVLPQEITLTSGRDDEASDTEPAEVSFVLDNGDGYLTPDDRRSPLYPHVVTGVPVRITVEGSVRFVGQVAAWSLGWPFGDNAPAGGDFPSESRVTVEAAGILRRLGQGTEPALSPLRRAFHRQLFPRIEAGADTVNYWPLETTHTKWRGEGGQQFRFVPTTVGQTRTQRPTISDEVESHATSGALEMPPAGDFAPEGPYEAVAPLILQRGEPWSASCYVVTPTYNDTDELTVAWFLHSDGGQQGADAPLGAYFHAMLYVETRYLEIVYRRYQNGVQVHAFAGGDWLPPDINPADGLLVTVAVNAAGTSATLWANDHELDTLTFPANPTAREMSRTGFVKLDYAGFEAEQFNGGKPAWYSHVIAISGPDATWANNADVRAIMGSAARAHVGEPAAVRFKRLCDEENVPVNVEGVGVPMGPQRPERLLPLLREVAATDLGIITEARATLGLNYRSGDTRYDRFPVAIGLDAANNEIVAPILPVRDDLDLRNDVTVTGIDIDDEVNLVDQASVARSGRYEASVTVNPADAGHIDQVGRFELYRGTWPGLRYRTVAVDLAVAPGKVPEWLDTDAGDWLSIDNLPVQHPEGTVTQVIEGLSETFSPSHWTASATCTPAGPWVAGTLALDPPTPPPAYDARLDTESAVLVDPVGPSDTSFEVETLAGPPWVDTVGFPGEFPFDVEVDGERFTVTAISEAVDDVQTFTVTRPDPKAHAAGAAVMVADPLIVTTF